MSRLTFIRPESMPVIGAAFSMIFWIMDSTVDFYVFNHRRFFVESLLGPDNMEIWSRLQVIALMMLFSLVAMVLLRRQIDITNQLNQYKNQLEDIVNERTQDLTAKNEQLKIEISERKKVEAKLEHLANIDPLTSILNRRKFNEIISYEVRRDERYRNNLSLIMCDLDKFKAINDKFGHDSGDMVLIEFAALVFKTIRKSDIFARWGGEEFAILLPETNLEKASQIASKLRLVTETHMMPQIGRITCSFGVAEYHAGDNEEDLIKRADIALYKAKSNGRNRVEISYRNETISRLSPVPG